MRLGDRQKEVVKLLGEGNTLRSQAGYNAYWYTPEGRLFYDGKVSAEMIDSLINKGVIEYQREPYPPRYILAEAGNKAYQEILEEEKRKEQERLNTRWQLEIIDYEYNVLNLQHKPYEHWAMQEIAAVLQAHYAGEEYEAVDLAQYNDITVRIWAPLTNGKRKLVREVTSLVYPKE